MLQLPLLCLLFCLQAAAAPSPGAQRDLFQRVEHDLKRGVHSSYLSAREKLRDYPLYPYLVYRDVGRRIARISDREMIALLKRYGGTVVGDRLRHRWLKHRARHGRWSVVAEHYVPSSYITDRAMPCYYARALLERGRAAEARELVTSLWLVGFSQAPACDAVFARAKRLGIIGDEQIWRRILLVLEKRRVRLADYLARSLSSRMAGDYRRLRQAHHNPPGVLSRMEPGSLSSPYQRDILLHALKREQKNNLPRAMRLWASLRGRVKDYPGFLNRVHTELGLAAAHQLESQTAYSQLTLLPPSARTPKAHDRLIRSALRLGRWHTVLREIEALGHDTRAEPQWRYWKARALQQTGRREQAAEIWRALARRSGYYGFLAADRIGAAYRWSAPYSVHASPAPGAIADLPAFKRVREFVLLNRLFDARREMNYLTDGLDVPARMQLAAWCRSRGWSSGVVQALASDAFLGETDLRFPMPWRELVAREAKRSRLPQHLIYGVMRRESGFVPRIKSSAGAVGLMQLMPATARETARRLRLSRPSPVRLLNPALNVRLGASYLSRVYGKNGRRLPLALAAYNAGPLRVKRWLAQTPVTDADVWIDTIPFDETRLYVRAVLFYSAAYQHKLQGRADRLKSVLSIR